MAWAFDSTTQKATESELGVSVQGVTSANGLSVNNKVVTIAASALGTGAVSIEGEGFTLALGSDVPTQPTTTSPHWVHSGDTVVYKDTEATASYTLSSDAKSITYTAASGGATLATLKGVNSNFISTDYIKTEGNVITISAGTLTQQDVTLDGSYTLALGSDVDAPKTTDEGFDGNVYKSAGTSEGYELASDSKSIKYTAEVKVEDLFQVSGVADTSKVTVNGTTVTFGAGSLNNANASLTALDGKNYTLALDSSYTAPGDVNPAFEGLNYKVGGKTAGYTLNGTNVTYSTAQTSSTAFTLSGVSGTEGIGVSGTTVTIPATVLNGTNVSISNQGNNNYTLALGAGVSGSTATAAHFSGNTYKSASNTAGYALASGNKNIVYTPAVAETDLFTLTGVANTNSVDVNTENKTVTVSNASLGKQDVTISGEGYSLALGSDVKTSTTTNAGWNTQVNNVAVYRGMSVTEGYVLESSNKIVYHSEVNGASVTVTGIRDITALNFDGSTNTVTVARKGLGQDIVTISEGYKLALDDDVPRSTTTPQGWAYSNGAATYTAEANSAGYKLENNQIIYSASNGGDEVEINGVTGYNGIAVSIDGAEKTLVIPASVLNKQKVEVSNEDYKLALATGVATPTSTPAGWTLDGAKATYKTASETEGYKVTDTNEIEYTKATNSTDVVEVTGVKDTKGLELITAESLVAVYNSALDPSSVVSANNGYTLELGSDVLESTVHTGYWTPNGTNMAYRVNETTEGYRVIDNQISYTNAVQGNTLAEFSGVTATSTPTVANNNGTIQFTPGNFEGSVAVVSSEVKNYEFNAGEYANKSFTANANIDNITNAGSNFAINSGAGSDKINNSGSGVTINGGAGDDNVTMNSAASVDAGNNNIFAYTSGDGKDILYNFDASDKIQFIGSPTIEESVKNKDVIFKVGNGTVTVRDAAEKELTITLVGSQESDIISSYRYTTNGITRGDVIELASTLKKPYTQENNIGTVDGRNVKDGAQIIGNDNGEGGIFIGGNGKDTLISGQNDFEMTGGKGNDLFVFGGGKDTIHDYSQKGTDGADKISLGSFEEVDYELDGENLILNFGENDSLTVVDGKGKEITFADKKSTVKIYDDAGVFDGKKKSLVLAASTEGDFSAGKLSKLVTINGSAVVNEMAITGNKKANLIIAGEANSTLNGGKGKDTLVGGNGVDMFIYETKSGNKVIQNYNYAQGDIISLSGGAEITSVTTKKDNVVLKVGNNTITIEGMAKSQFTFANVVEVDGENVIETKIYDNERLVSQDGKSATLSSDFKGAFDLTSAAYSQYTNVSAELGKKPVSLTGDADDNILTGGAGKDSLSGGDNNDSLWGGKGNDYLTGGDGADTFIFRAGEGTDVITDYNAEDGDLLQILDKRGRVISSGAIKNWSFDGEDLNLSIKGGGKLILTGVGTSATVNYNSTVQTFTNTNS